MIYLNISLSEFYVVGNRWNDRKQIDFYRFGCIIQAIIIESYAPGVVTGISVVEGKIPFSAPAFAFGSSGGPVSQREVQSMVVRQPVVVSFGVNRHPRTHVSISSDRVCGGRPAIENPFRRCGQPFVEVVGQDKVDRMLMVQR